VPVFDCLLQAETFWHRIKQMQQDDVPVYVTVTAATRGGLLVQYNHLEGFIPASHLGQVRAAACCS
jgi:ribosomal protein S1